MTVKEYIAAMDKQDRVGVVGYADGALLEIRGLDEDEVACAAYLTWACPDYLAPKIGLAFECKNPGTADRQVCRRCARAFLRARYPNTGRRKAHETD